MKEVIKNIETVVLAKNYISVNKQVREEAWRFIEHQTENYQDKLNIINRIIFSELLSYERSNRTSLSSSHRSSRASSQESSRMANHASSQDSSWTSILASGRASSLGSG